MDLDKTLEELDGEAWGDAPADATGLVRDIYRARRVRLSDLSNGDLRMLLGQKVGADWLIPVALDRLADAPLTGDWYPGDLIGAVLEAGSGYWSDHPTEHLRLWRVREALERTRDDAEKALNDARWPAFR
jgi:hypothetical protein